MNQDNYNRLVTYAKTDDDAIAVFGGAAFAHNINDIVEMLKHVIFDSRFRKRNIVDDMRTFCHLCGTDPALIEAYIGIRFEKIIEVL